MTSRLPAAVVAIVVGLAGLTACRSASRDPAPPPSPPPVDATAPTPAAAEASGVAVATPLAFERVVADVHGRLAEDARVPLPPDEVGYYMDVLQARLQQLGAVGLSVTRDGPSIVLTLAGETPFESGSSRLTADTAEALVAIGSVLSDYDRTLVSVHGHTDATGSDEVNRDLSQRRALAVARVFIDRGVAARRLVAVGYGPARPVASNDTEDGRRRNRRIEIRLDPIMPRPPAGRVRSDLGRHRVAVGARAKEPGQRGETTSAVD